jgi:hypothetical protein
MIAMSKGSASLFSTVMEQLHYFANIDALMDDCPMRTIAWAALIEPSVNAVLILLAVLLIALSLRFKRVSAFLVWSTALKFRLKSISLTVPEVGQ